MINVNDGIDFLKGVITRKVKTYNPNDTNILIGGSLFLDGITSISVSEEIKSRGVTGLDEQYYAVIEAQTQGRTVTVGVLPTALCYKELQNLSKFCKDNKVSTTLHIIENGEYEQGYTAHIISFGNREITSEGNDRYITFGIKPKFNKPTIFRDGVEVS